jgi:hypothetical protein
MCIHGGELYDITKLAEDLGFYIRKSDEDKSKFTVSKDENGNPVWKAEFDFIKLDDEKRLVGGIVYEPDVVDSQGDSASASEIEKAAHGFMIESRVIGIMHKEAAGKRVDIVESYIVRSPFQMGNRMIKTGTWFLVVKVNDDELWAGVKSGKLTGFSMGGRAEAE